MYKVSNIKDPLRGAAITGWDHSTCANVNTDYAAERNQYNGRDGGEPSWIDNGPKGGKK